MSVHITAYILCDWCKATLPSTHSEASARDAAHARGWKRRKRQNRSMGDICPQCLVQEDMRRAGVAQA
jgi:ribosomal protein L34E